MRPSHSIRFCFLLPLGALGVAAVPACGGSSPPSCSAAVAHMYNQGCVLTVNGNAEDQSDAVNGCASLQDRINTNNCPCENQLNAVLSCVDAVSNDQCGSCGGQWSDLDACMNGNSSCS